MTGDKPLKILHVDDEENQLEFTKLFLEQIDKDVEIDSVTTPEKALEMQEQENYDCIVSDYKMLSMNGIELAQKVREKSDIPFILYTGQGSEEVAELAFTSGVDDYLRKETEPTHYQVLAKRIKHTVEKHRTEELYRKVVEESRDAIIIIVDNKAAFMNQAACDMIGVEGTQDCIGKDIFELFPDDAKKIFKQKRDEKGNYIVQINFRTKTGGLRDAEISVSKINYRGEEAYLCFIRDVTERKRNEERLEAIYQQATRLGTTSSTQEVSETTLDLMESVFDYHNITFNIVEGNQLTTLAARGTPSIYTSIPLTGPGVIAMVARESQSVLISDISTCSEFTKGDTDAVSELAVPVVLNGETVAVLNLDSQNKNDFTEADRKLLETLAYHVAFAFSRIHTQALEERETEEKLERLNYALSVLDNAEKVSTLVSRDLQRSIFSILNATGLLRIQPDMLLKAVNSINEQADIANNVSDLIIETITQSLDIKDFIEVNQSTRNILDKTDIPRNIRIKTQYAEGVLLVEVEEEKFFHIMNNLLANAIEAMPSGGSLSIKITAKDDRVYVDISDTGPGIPENLFDNVFKPFYSTKTGHSGLGLAFCKNTVEAIGGSLNIKTSSEKGTTFRLELPVIRMRTRGST